MPQSSQQASAVVYLGIVRLGRVLHVRVCVHPQVLVASLALSVRLPGLLSSSHAWRKTSFRSIGACQEKSCWRLLVRSKGGSSFSCGSVRGGIPSVMTVCNEKNRKWTGSYNEHVISHTVKWAFVHPSVCVCVCFPLMKSLIKAAHVDPNFPFGDHGPHFIRRPPAQQVVTLCVRESTLSDVLLLREVERKRKKKKTCVKRLVSLNELNPLLLILDGWSPEGKDSNHSSASPSVCGGMWLLLRHLEFSRSGRRYLRG